MKSNLEKEPIYNVFAWSFSNRLLSSWLSSSWRAELGRFGRSWLLPRLLQRSQISPSYAKSPTGLERHVVLEYQGWGYQKITVLRPSSLMLNASTPMEIWLIWTHRNAWNQEISLQTVPNGLSSTDDYRCQWLLERRCLSLRRCTQQWRQGQDPHAQGLGS